MEKPSIMSVQINEDSIQEILNDQIQEHLDKVDNEPVFYTLDDLQEITGMSRGFIEKTFFYDPRFERIRRKVGRKWLFPVKETRKFLLEWLEEQPHY